MRKAFLNPRLVGGRFDEHTVPLEVLKDFSALEEMVVEVAKWKFRQAHPDSKRVQRNFSQGHELHLAQVEVGSAIPAIVLMTAGPQPTPNAQYFEQARAEIIAAIDHAERGAAPTLPNHLLSYFDRFGRSLRDGESIEFQTDTKRIVTYTPKLRKKLVQFAEIETWTEELSLRGRVATINQEKRNFVLVLPDGRQIAGPLTDQHWTAVLEAVQAYRQGGYVIVQGVVEKDRQGHLRGFESVEHISPLDPLDVTLRLSAITELEAGWLDGKGQVPEPGHSHWLAQAFDENFDVNLPLPHLYPTAEGGIQAEWTFGDWEVSLEIDLSTRQGAYQALHLLTQNQRDETIMLSDQVGWQRLNTVLKQMDGAQA
jgi:hypothetical protein